MYRAGCPQLGITLGISRTGVLLSGSGGFAGGYAGLDFGAAEGWDGGGGLAAGGELGQQAGGDGGYLGDGDFEGGASGVREGVDAGDFADVLAGGGFDLLGGGGGLEAAEDGDVSAHAAQGTGFSRHAGCVEGGRWGTGWACYEM